MKKKLISLLLVSAMAAATAGCGSSVPANSVNSRDDLPGKKIGVQLGTTGDSDATEYEKNDGSTVMQRIVRQGLDMLRKEMC